MNPIMRFSITLAGVALLVGIIGALGYWLLAPTPQSLPVVTESLAVPLDISASILERARDYDPSAQLRQVTFTPKNNASTYVFVGAKGFSITSVDDGAFPYLTDLPEDSVGEYIHFKPLSHWSIDAPMAIAHAENAGESLRGTVENALLRHVSESQFHGGDEPPPSLITPPNPYWVIFARKNFPFTMRAVYIDAVTGEKLFATDFALK